MDITIMNMFKVVSLIPATVLTTAFIIWTIQEKIEKIMEEKKKVPKPPKSTPSIPTHPSLLEAQIYSEEWSKKQKKEELIQNHFQQNNLQKQTELKKSLFHNNTLEKPFTPFHQGVYYIEDTMQMKSSKSKLTDYLHEVIYRKGDIYFENAPFVTKIDIHKNEKNGMISLWHNEEKLFSAYVDIEKKRRGFIQMYHFKEYNRFLILQFFDIIVSEHLKNLIAHKEKEPSESFAKVKRVNYKTKTTEKNTLLEEVENQHKTIVLSVQKIIQSNKQIDFELLHQMQHHFIEDIGNIVEMYRNLSIEGQKKVHSNIMEKMKKSSHYLRYKLQDLEKQKINDIKAELQLLEMRTHD